MASPIPVIRLPLPLTMIKAQIDDLVEIHSPIGGARHERVQARVALERLSRPAVESGRCGSEAARCAAASGSPSTIE
jgi:hypothetical protein